MRNSVLILFLFLVAFVVSEPKSAIYEITLAKDLISYSLSNGNIDNGAIKILGSREVEELLAIEDNTERDIAILGMITKGAKNIETNQLDVIFKENNLWQLDTGKLYSGKLPNFASLIHRITEDSISAQEISGDQNFKTKTIDNLQNIYEQRFNTIKSFYQGRNFNRNFKSFKANCYLDEQGKVFRFNSNNLEVVDINQCYSKEDLRDRRRPRIDNAHYRIISNCKIGLSKLQLSCS